jgi:hypothetical protein
MIETGWGLTRTAWRARGDHGDPMRPGGDIIVAARSRILVAPSSSSSKTLIRQKQ